MTWVMLGLAVSVVAGFAGLVQWERRRLAQPWRALGLQGLKSLTGTVHGRGVRVIPYANELSVGMSLAAWPSVQDTPHDRLTLRERAIWYRGPYPADNGALLDWMAGQAHAIDQSGGWVQAAQSLGVTVRIQDHLRVIDAPGVRIRQTPDGCTVRVPAPRRVRAQPGSGNSGNAVLDLLVDSQNVPEPCVGGVLELVREHDGRIADGRMTLRTQARPDRALRWAQALARQLED